MKVDVKELLSSAGLENEGFYPGKRIVKQYVQHGEYKSHCAVFDWNSQMTLLSIGLAASCAGGVCGDHLSPISDTTIMASAGAHCFHLNHVATQIPYGITVAAVSFVSFIIAGIVQSAVVCMIIAIVLMIATLLVIKAVTAKKHAGIFQEMAEADKVLYNK